MILLIVSVFLIPLAVILSSIIHFQLSNITFVLDLKAMIESIISNRNHLQLFILMQLFLEIIIIYTLSFNKNSLSTETNEITKSIKTPKVYGNGQYGTARWSDKKELYKKLTTNSIDINDNVENIKFKKGGIVVGLEKSRKKENIVCISEDYHTLIIGSTGAGKTRRILLPSLCNYLFAGESVICTDPKGEILQYTLPLLKKLNYKIITIDFKNPLKSTRYNFLQPVIDAFKKRRCEKS